jgi:WD40 repeat protein
LQSKEYSFGLDYYHVDIIGGNMIIIHYPEWVTLYFIEPKEFASKHSMTAITHYDLNDEKVVALAGPSINGKVDRIIVKAISSEEYLFSTTIADSVQDLALSQKEGKVAVCSSDSTVRVWDVSSKALIFERKVEGDTGVEFRGENTLLIKHKDGEEEVRLDGETVVSDSVTAEVSSDGSIISVRSSKGELIAALHVPSRGERFVSVTVSPSEGIIAATDANKLYVWTPKQTSQLTSEEEGSQMADE